MRRTFPHDGPGRSKETCIDSVQDTNCSQESSTLTSKKLFRKSSSRPLLSETLSHMRQGLVVRTQHLQFAQERFRPSEIRISKPADPTHCGAQRHAIRCDKFDSVNIFRGAAGTGKNARCTHAANRPLKAVIYRNLSNNEGRCKIGAGEVPPDGLNAFGVRSQTIALAYNQLSRGTQIDAELKLVVVEGFSRGRPPRSNQHGTQWADGPGLRSWD
jgi:hypothetical protein